ncbi:sulfite exporter TauE/SafE family protein [Streptomyces sp. NPDC001414]
MDSTGPIVLAGALVGFAVGLTGMGGGALMTPIMVMVFGVNPTAAIGSDLAASVFMKPFGALVHQRAGTVRWDIVRLLLPTAVPAAFGGVFLLRALGDGDDLQQRVKYIVGTALLLAVAGMLARLWLDRRRAVGGAGSEDAEDAEVRVRPVATLLIGAVPGVLLGSVVSSRVAGGAVRWALVVLLTGSGLSMLKAQSAVIVLGCLGAALLGVTVAVRDRRTARLRAAAGTADRTAREDVAGRTGPLASAPGTRRPR